MIDAAKIAITAETTKHILGKRHRFVTNETIKTIRNLNDFMPGRRFCGRRLSADLGDGIKRNYLNVAYGIVGFGVDIIELSKILERATYGLR